MVQHDVFADLAGANLSRIRGNYAEAERRCQEILRQLPNHPAPHSLLGEIYEDQGRFGEAITEYQLALELDPSSEADRSLLARAMQRQLSAPRRTAGLDSQVALQREFGVGRSRPWLPVTILALLCLLVIGFLGFRLAHPSGRGGLSGAAASGVSNGEGRGYSLPPGGTPTNTANPPAAAGGTAGVTAANTSPGSRGDAPASTAATGNPASSQPSAGPAAGATAAAGGTTPEEASLLASLVSSSAASRAGVPAYTVDSARSDPRVGASYARITIHLNQALGTAGGKDLVLRAAAAVAAAASSAHLAWITIRVTGSAGPDPPSLLFIGEAVPSSLQNVDPGTVTVANAASLFQNAWWNPSLPPG